ncbi:exported protein of unknown function [Kyrpidia spormannii]|uniref:Uncharacterized protein n=1 Tax=Kyrpidia spormannii TaxID=2055160 RepID=A0ACA8ZFP5_9BACL|nr:exported protein of unknown function [Kyrpidia spormannii]
MCCRPCSKGSAARSSRPWPAASRWLPAGWGASQRGEGLAGVRLVPSGDPYTVAAAVDGMARERLETPDLDAVARLCSLERMVARTEDVYAEILVKMAP